MLAVGIVHLYLWELQLSFVCQGDQANNAGGGFLAAADHMFDLFRIFCVECIDQIAAIVEYVRSL